jgi:hypothetical protein
MAIYQGLKERREFTKWMRRKSFNSEGEVIAKAPRRDYACCAQEAARKPVRLQ